MGRLQQTSNSMVGCGFGIMSCGCLMIVLPAMVLIIGVVVLALCGVE